MARGFESKAVAEQQEEALNRKRVRPEKKGNPVVAQKRRRLELALADVRQRIEQARSEVHRGMLERAVADLETELKKLPQCPPTGDSG